MVNLPSVGIIILNWNGKFDTSECINSLNKIRYPKYEIIVVDNGSSDNSVAYLKKRYPYIKILENKKNEGFARGNNRGIKYTIGKHDYILILNNDTVVDKKFLNYLIETAEKDYTTGAVGPKVYFYGTKKIQALGGKMNMWKAETKLLIKNKVYPHEVNFIPGCAILIRSEVIKKVGDLDPNFFLYYEDTDICMRIKKRNYRIIADPRSIIWHKGGVSTSKDRLNMLYYAARTRFMFIKKYGSILNRVSSLFYYFIFKFPIYSLSLIIRNKSFTDFKKFCQVIPDSIKILFFS